MRSPRQSALPPLAGEYRCDGGASDETTAALGAGPARGSSASDWDRRVEHVEALAQTPGFFSLRERILELAQLETGDRLLDVGSGTGLLALAAAPYVASVIALDLSPAMCCRLERNSATLGLENLETLTHPATSLPLDDYSVDVVVSNYCFHHLGHADKRRALAEIRRVLRPGGRLVFADMMFDLGLRKRRDRAVIAGVARKLLRHGPGGVVRLARNGLRVATRRAERPAGVEWWHAALQRSGFVDVVVEALDHEGGIARARRPA